MVEYTGSVYPSEQEIDPFEVAGEVNADTSLSQNLRNQGNVLYSPNTELTHLGTLKAVYPNGDEEYGYFVNGEFFAVRGKTKTIGDNLPNSSNAKKADPSL